MGNVYGNIYIMNEAEIASTIIQEAAELVKGDRHQEHGDIPINFANIAALWGAYLNIEIRPVDVALMMVLLKVARTQGRTGIKKRDNYVDMAGYAGIAGMFGIEDET